MRSEAKQPQPKAESSGMAVQNPNVRRPPANLPTPTSPGSNLPKPPELERQPSRTEE